MDNVAQAGGGVGVLVAIVSATLVVSFFCSVCEAALYAVSPGRVERLGHAGSPGGIRLQKLRAHIDLPIAAILTLNTIANTVGATLAGSVAATLYDSLGVGLFSGLFTLAILYFSEIIPKTLGVLYADTLAPLLSLPITVCIWAQWPLVWLCRQVTRLFPRRGTGGTSEEDLLALARSGLRSGTIRPNEARWMRNALQLDTMKVSDVLTPRTVVFSLPKETPLRDVSRILPGWTHSRAVITEGSDLDKVAGMVLRRDVYEAVVAGDTARTLADIMRPPIFVPEAMSVSDLLEKFLRERQHLFIVADEYGGTAGIVTLEDAIETLLGSEIVDEFDREADLQRLARRKAAQKLKAGSSQRPDGTR